MTTDEPTAFELLTKEGEVIYFDTEDDRTDYVLSHMIETGRIKPIGRTAGGDLVVGMPGK